MRRRRDDRLVERNRLLDRLAAARIALVEAPGGYGKTTLAGQLGERLGCATARAVLDREVDTAGLAQELRRAFVAAALSDAVLAVDASDDPLGAAFEAVSRRDEPVVVVIDEVQRLGPEAAQALVRAARTVAPQVRLLLCGRRLPSPLPRLLDEPGAVDLGTTELRFDRDETERALAATVGGSAALLAPSVAAATDGWPAAVALAARQLAGNPERSLTGLGRGAAVLGRLLDGAIGALPERARSVLPTLAALPLLDQRLVDDLFGPGTFDACLDAGLVLVARRDGWSTMPDPVREVLAERGPVHPPTLVAAAFGLRAAGEPAAAADLMARHAAGTDDHARFLTGATPGELEALGLPRLAAYVGLFDDAVLGRHPGLLVDAAVAAELRDDGLRTAWLDRAAALTDGQHPCVHRRVEAERLADRVRLGDPTPVAAEAEGLLDRLGPAETLTRARALMAMAVARVLTLPPARRVELRGPLHEAAELLGLAGRTRWQAAALRQLGYSVEYHLGDYARSLAAFERVLALLAAPDRDRALSLTYYAEVLEASGRAEEGAAAVREARAIAEHTGDARAHWFACWTGVLLATRTGDRATIDACLAEIDRVLGPVPEDGNGFEFLVTVGDALVGMGDVERGRRFLDRARPLAVRLQRPSAIEMADARLLALEGDPAEALALLDRIEETPYAIPEQRWVRQLERAIASRRSGDEAGARALATDAMACAAALGQPDLPWRYEPRLAALVADLVGGDEGDGAAARAVTVRVLGPLRVQRGDHDVTPAPGHGSTLVALVALRRSVPADEAIELLWPDVDDATGRSRLRNLLNRVRERAGDVVLRDGDRLVLATGVEVDVAAFERLADDALAAQPAERCGRARLAIAQWGGEPLADLRFADWAAAPRERLRRRFGALLEVVVDDTLARGELDDAIRHLELAIDHEPLQEEHHARLVRALVRQGRRAAARRALDAAHRVADELGVRPSDELRALAAELAG